MAVHFAARAMIEDNWAIDKLHSSVGFNVSHGLIVGGEVEIDVRVQPERQTYLLDKNKSDGIISIF